MKHQKKGRVLKRKTGPRKALLRILAKELVLYGKIKTTEAKAKELRRYFERLITVSKKGTLSSNRKLISEFNDRAIVKKITKELGEQFKKRNGGYTRISKLGRRKGDNASLVQIEII